MDIYSSDYMLFMTEAYNEAYNEQLLYEAGGKSGDVYKINYYLRDNLQNKYVAPILQKARNRTLIIDFVAKFLDKHHEVFAEPGPIHSFVFGKNETDFFYDLFGLSAEKILEILKELEKETYNGRITPVIASLVIRAPHKLLFTSMIIESLQKEYDDIVEACEYLWAFCEYPILYAKQWRLGVNEEVMRYTLEHLPGKFKIVNKKLYTLEALLKYDASSALTPYKESMKNDGADHLSLDFIYRIRNQFKSTLVNISNQYYDNISANNTQHTNVSEFDDGTKADQDGVNTNISHTVDKTVAKFASGEINGPIVRVIAEGAQIDKGNLSGYLSQIFATKNNQVAKFVEILITYYFTKQNVTTITNGEFLNFALALFRSIATSKDPMLNDLRKILDFWMYDIINIKEAYQRPATITAYSRGVFNYFVFMIAYYN